jgi:hypothetical protein
MSQTSLYNKANINLVTTEVTTRVGIFLGLDFTTTKTLELNSNKYLSTIPSFSFSSDFGRVIIDYSNSQNATDISLVNGLFSSLTAGTTFTVSSAKYSLDGIGSEADLAGTYEFKSFVSNVIVAVPVSMTSFNQRLLRYESDYFINPPQFGLSLAPVGQFTEYVIVNALGTDKTSSFAKFGIYAGDKVKITGTQFNNSTFTIKSVTVNKDGSETMVVNEGLTQESGFGNRVGIELIQNKKGSAIITAATGPTTTGACGVYVNGVRVACYDNQTSDQCVARTTVTGGSPFYWIPGGNCSLLPSTLVTTTVQTFTGNVVTTNPLASLANLGYL